MQTEADLVEIGHLIKRSTAVGTVDTGKVIVQLRERGLSKIESIIILVKAFGIKYQDAIHLVHNSSTWHDFKEADEELNKQFIEAMRMSDAQEEPFG